MRSVLFLAALLPVGLAQVVGKPSGFATGTTGGGSAKPAIPKDNAQLVQWLTDDVARVIMLDKTYDFNAAEGRKTETGCRPDSNTCGAKGQDALNGPNWCSASYPKVTVTYNVAPTKPIDIKGNKSIVGVGNRGIIKGKGFRLVNNVKNIIIQNVHFTDLNPQYIWGGDALQLAGTDMVWIDHCKFSLVGRQMIVTGYASAGRVTISNNDFDGRTSWSASCNNQHYWTLLLIGEGDKITFSGNFVHSVSGRAPKVGSKATIHAVNNYFADSQGHNFDIEAGGNVLLEGNYFQDCKTPIAATAAQIKGNLFNVPNASAASQCTAAIGRACAVNILANSGSFPAQTNNNVINAFNGIRNAPTAGSAQNIPNNVSKNAGIGKIGN